MSEMSILLSGLFKTLNVVQWISTNPPRHLTKFPDSKSHVTDKVK